MRIVVLDDHADALRRVVGLDALAGHDVTIHADAAADEEALVARLSGAEVALLIQQRCALPRRVIARLPALRLVSQTGRNVSHIDLAACREHGVLVSARGAGPSPATAELTWGLILAAWRDIPRQSARLRQGLWLDGIGRNLEGRTLGVWGLGDTGARVARIGAGFGMRVLAFGREASRAKARAAGHDVARDAEELFAAPDILSLHMALNDGTRGIVTPALLALMKPDSLLVNTARAGLVAPGALHAALRAGRPGHAALDVFEREPVPREGDPLLALANVTATPHLGYSVEEMYRPLLTQAVEQILAYAAGGPINLVGT
jgi:D-3-phosphoglycerate dehydrogenase